MLTTWLGAIVWKQSSHSATLPISTSAQPATRPEAPSHRFWDRENSLLFVTSFAFSTAGLFVTRNNLHNGGQELNPVIRLFAGSTAGLALNFAGETAGVVGLSYFFHKTGRHKLERAVSMLNMGCSAEAVTFDLAHQLGSLKQRASVEVVFIQNYFWLTGSRQSGTELPEGLLGARFGISADAQFELSLRIPSALIAFTT